MSSPSADSTTSLTLNSTIVASGFANDGSPATGQVPSLTSTNNFINFCLTYPNLPNTNGSQVASGSCNSAPMGAIPSIQNIPSVKIISPKHGDTIQPNTELQVSFAVQNMEVGAPVDSQVNYLSAPQQLNNQGVIKGSAFMVVEELSSLTDTQPGNPQRFSLFQGIQGAPVNGVLQGRITNGLPSGLYRLTTQLRASNRQPILVSTPEHGSLADMIYFTVGDGNDADSVASSGTAIVGNSIVPAAVNTQDSSQSSLTLDPKVISAASASPGQSPTPGITGSLTSTNNFINFCMSLANTRLTNGEVVPAGSCNPVPMGVLPANTLMPSSKFTNPKNGDNIPARKAFTISLAVRNFQTGSLANPQKSFLAAPQQVNAQGLIIGHAKVVIEALTGFNQTTPTDPTKFAFFQHIGSQAQGGILTASVSDGLPDGYYRLSSMLSATNSQPVILPIFQVGMSDDAVYFTVGDPTKVTTTDGGDSGKGSGSKGSDDPSPSSSAPSAKSDNKAAIIGGVLGGVLGAIIMCALVYAILRYRRRKRPRRSVDLDTEVAQVPVTPFGQATLAPTYRREKPLPAGPSETSGPSSAASLLGRESQTAGPSSSSSAFGHSEISQSRKSVAETSPPPYQP
ncbi:hypothetical protein CCMSSC00406_0003942 [Pleurotus cornucopiae]|uniref:Uncharacterized protein n=1 Tax=Pleurotus cornucopiae TaxID=5321 RepID=A0ACB7IS78_PLECO|nr:hypothetical protein CCMSSC00406_0003942 [Pleurotus cornucopiae]